MPPQNEYVELIKASKRTAESMSRVVSRLNNYITLEKKRRNGEIKSIEFSEEEILDALWAGGIDVIPQSIWEMMLNEVTKYADDSVRNEPAECKGFKILAESLHEDLPKWCLLVKNRDFFTIRKEDLIRR